MKSLGILGVGLAGVFVGALAMEVVHRVRPNLVKEIGQGTRKTLRMFSNAFKEGYYGEQSSRKELATSI